MCDCDIEGPEVFHKQTRRAAKDYKCDECRRVISKGEQYEIHAGMWDGIGHRAWSTYRWCAHCAASQAIYAELDGCHCWLYTDLWSDIEGAARWNQKSSVLGRLVISARRKWTVRRGPRAGQLMAVPKAAEAAVT